MHLGVLFYSDTIVFAQQPRDLKGRAVANHGLVRALLRPGRGHYVTLIVSGPTERQLVQDFFGEVVRSPNVELVTLRELAAAVRARPLDVLHVLGPDLYRGLALRAAFPAQRCVVTGMTHTIAHDPFLGWLWLSLLAGPSAADCLVCTAPTAEQAIQAMLATCRARLPDAALATRVIPLGVEVGDFARAAPLSRATLQLGADDIVLLSCARFSYYTKTDLIPVLLALRELTRQTAKPVALVLAGATGEERYPELLQLVAQEYGVAAHVRFVPNPSETTKRGLLKMADVFVAPSDNLQETFGLSVIEALAAGLPVVAADWDGYRTLVRDGVDGFLIPTCAPRRCDTLEQTAPLQLDSLAQLFRAQAVAMDLTLLVERLRTLVEQDDVRCAMAAQAGARGRTFDWSRIVPQYGALWQELVAQAANAVVSPPLAVTLDAYAAFHHYPTTRLQPTTRVLVTPRGQEFLCGTLPVRMYEAMEEILSVPLLTALLQRAATETTVDALTAACAPLVTSADLIPYHVAWLAKYGCVRLGGSDSIPNNAVPS